MGGKNMPNSPIDPVTNENKSKKNLRKKKGRGLAIFSFLLSLAYVIYIISYFGNISMESIGGFLATSIVMPHMLCAGLGAIFLGVGSICYKGWGVLTGSILLAVAAILFPTYALMVIIQTVIGFISYAIIQKNC